MLGWMQLARSWRARALALALGYYLCGRLALLMAIPPGYATAVWPAAGLALVGVLALGWRSFPAVMLGSFMVNIQTSLETSDASGLPQALALALAIGLGAALQAAVGAEMVRRAVGYPNSFDGARDVVLLLLLGGPLACVASATCGTLTLLAAGLMRPEALPFNWFTWWVGDTIGVLVFAPLLLAFIGEPRESWRRRRWAVGIPPFFGFIMVVALFLSVSRREQQRIEGEFIRRCEPIAHAILAQVGQSVHVGGSVASLLHVIPAISQAEFSTFAADVMDRQPGIQALSWIERVTATERAAWEAVHSRRITQLASDGKLVPASPAAEHFVVSWIVPEAANAIAVGFDVGSEPVRLAAVRAASASGAPSTTRPIRLVQGTQGTTGVLILEPIGPIGQSGSGFSSTVLSVDRLVAAARVDLPADGILLRLIDEADGTEIFDDGGPRPDAPLWKTTLSVEGRAWRAEFRSTKAYRERQRSWQAWGVLAFGLILVALSEFALLVSTGREGRLAAAEDRANALLRAMPDTILRMGPDGSVRDYRAAAPDGSGPSSPGEPGLAVPPGLSTAFPVMVQLLRTTGAPCRTEYRELLPDGEHDFEARFVAGAGDDVLVVIRDVSAQKSSERLIQEALAEKDVLLREIHHRVKNNLQVVSSLLNLSEERLEDPAARALLSHTRSRVRTIALVHDQLHRSDDLAHVGFGAYLRTLATRLPAAVGDGTDRVQIEVSGDDLTLPLDVAMPCGLIVNELVTNAIIHAFPDGNVGTVRVSIRALPNDRAELLVQDDGVGPPAGWNPRASGGTGLELVFTFAEQLEAEVTVATSPGLAFTFTFALKPA